MTSATVTAGKRAWAWRIYLILGLLAVAGYSLLPSDSIAALNICTLAIGASAVVAILLGIRLNRPAYSRPWYLILIGELMLLTADAVWGYYEVVLSIESPFPSWADVIYLASYVLLAAGLSLLVRSRTSDGDRGNLIDATIIAMGAGVVSWVYIVEPRIDASMGFIELLVSVAYPLMDVLLLALVARLLFSPGARPWSFYFVCASLVSTLISDVFFAVAEANDTYAIGSTIDYGWLLAYVAWGLAALHPSMRVLSEPGVEHQTKLTGRRIVLLAAASLLAPAVLAIQYLRGEPANVPVIVGGSVVLFLLSLVRLNGLVRMLGVALTKLEVAVRKHQRAVDRERILRRAASDSAAALDRESIYSATLSAAQELLKDSSRSNVSIALGSVGSMNVTTATGPNAAKAENGHLDLGTLPDAVTNALLEKRCIALELAKYPSASALNAISGLDAGEVFVTPLVVQEEVRGAILAAADPEVPEEARRGLETLGSQVALALESAALTEDLHRRRGEERFRSLVQNASDIITILDSSGVVRYASASYERVLGYKPEDVVGTENLSLVHSDDIVRVKRHFARAADALGVSPPLELRMRHQNGSWRNMESIVNNLLDDPNVRGVVVNSRDVTERKRVEEMLSHQAFHDSLTDLPNRSLFMDRLGHALVRAEGRGCSVAVLFLDLDRFKVVNDSLGHEMGDRLLKLVATRLREHLRPEDTVARLGGDEFTILLEDAADESEPRRLAERIAVALRTPFVVEGHEVFVTASVGVVLNAPGQDEPSDLLRDADIAMYEAKNKGKARYEVFDASMKAYASRRLELENQLRRAIEHQELRVYYQPQVHLGSGSIVGMEALVRWEHPERGLVSPAEFIPLAEETRLIVPLGRWVLEKACRQAKEWQDRHPSECPLLMSVNLSARQLQQPNLTEEVARVLRITELNPASLVLEITESAMMENAQADMATLQSLKDLGVKLAIDDFGTGYSNLGYLKRFPVDIIKVDKSFVHNLGQDPEDTALVQAVVSLSYALALETIAEGIETTEQLAQLQSLGCGLGQGYHFAKPLPAGEATKLLQKGHRDAPVPEGVGHLPRCTLRPEPLTEASPQTQSGQAPRR